MRTDIRPLFLSYFFFFFFKQGKQVLLFQFFRFISLILLIKKQKKHSRKKPHKFLSYKQVWFFVCLFFPFLLCQKELKERNLSILLFHVSLNDLPKLLLLVLQREPKEQIFVLHSSFSSLSTSILISFCYTLKRNKNLKMCSVVKNLTVPSNMIKAHQLITATK